MQRELVAEIEIIRQAQKGNQDAYGTLYQHHFDAVYHYVNKRVDTSGDAEDLTQTIFLKAWQGLPDYQPAATPFRAWLYRIAHNTVIDHYRANKHSRKQNTPLLWDDLATVSDRHDGPDLLAIDQERRAILQRAIGTLRPSYQQIIRRRFVDEMDYAETASELGLQVNNLRVLQHRALDALRRVLSQDAAVAMVVAVIMLILGRQLVVSTLRSLPGDGLYSLRMMAEQTNLALVSDEANIDLHSQYAHQRIDELRQLAQQGRTEEMPIAVQNLATQIQSAVALLEQTGQSGQAVGQQFVASLASQTQELTTLLASNPAQLQPILQPAFDAIAAAERTLVNDSLPASDDRLPTPTPEVATPIAPAQATATTIVASEPTPVATNIVTPVLLPTPTPTSLTLQQETGQSPAAAAPISAPLVAEPAAAQPSTDTPPALPTQPSPPIEAETQRQIEEVALPAAEPNIPPTAAPAEPPPSEQPPPAEPQPPVAESTSGSPPSADAGQPGAPSPAPPQEQSPPPAVPEGAPTDVPPQPSPEPPPQRPPGNPHPGRPPSPPGGGRPEHERPNHP